MSTKTTHTTAVPKAVAPTKRVSTPQVHGKRRVSPAKSVAPSRATKSRRPRSEVTPVSPPPESQLPDTKQSRLISLLRSSEGGTIEQMTSLTGWQPHTVRGTISGVLRKRLGLNVICVPADGDAPRVYRIAASA